MINKMACLGFSKSSRDLQQYALHAIAKGTSIQSKQGSYVKWSAGNGIELWIQLDNAGEIIGVSPHFSGQARMRVAIIKSIRPLDSTPLDGSYYGWADPEIDSEPETGCYPFVFEAPDFDLQSEFAMPFITDVQLTAFAVELQAYQTMQEYLDSQDDEDDVEVESFIPAGLFTVEGEPRDVPQAYAIFTGEIIDTAEIVNTLTDTPFCWARVQTLGGQIDLISELNNIDGELIKGGVISGSFWLTGQLIKT